MQRSNFFAFWIYPSFLSLSLSLSHVGKSSAVYGMVGNPDLLILGLNDILKCGSAAKCWFYSTSEAQIPLSRKWYCVGICAWMFGLISWFPFLHITKKTQGQKLHGCSNVSQQQSVFCSDLSSNFGAPSGAGHILLIRYLESTLFF